MSNKKFSWTKNIKREMVSTIEVSKFKEFDEYSMRYYDGMYTIRNINEKTSDDLFYFFPHRNMISGYFEADSEKTLNLINGKKKLVRSICNSFYHSIMDDISEIICAMEMYPDHELLLDVSHIEYGIHGKEGYWDVFDFFTEALEKKNIRYRLVSLQDYDVIYMDNFRVVEFIYQSGQKAELVHNFFKEFVTNKDIKPYKNVFVSRAKREHGGLLGEIKEAETLSVNKDVRLDDHDGAEKYFADLGYEIVHSEFFKTFQEQLDYFYSVKTIASVSGSGLTNAVFMQPGITTMIEIVTPLVVSVAPPNKPKDVTNPFFTQEIHNFYKMLAFYMDQTYLAIQNSERKLQHIKDVIESDKKVKDFVDKNE